MQHREGRTCPGEAECSTTPGQPLKRYAGQPVETICGGCSLRTTKPELLTVRETQALDAATDLANLKDLGAVFAYPTSLTPFEWAAMRGLCDGKSRAESAEQQRDRKKLRRK